MRPFIFLFAYCYCCFNLSAQTDTILAWDVSSCSFERLLPVPADTSLQFDTTASYQGSFGNMVLLKQEPPSPGLFPGSGFSDLIRASFFFPVTAYPVRTSVKLFGYKNDTIRHNCTGVLVGNRYVLTAAHCLVTFKNWHNDSILAVPAYDNGRYKTVLPYSKVDKYYFFSSWYHSFQKDIALLELRDPIGLEVGWIGMAVVKDTAYFRDKVFHKFSYPAAASLQDPGKVYNGDTLYYNRAYIRPGLPGFIESAGDQAMGVPGQSGSSLMYTDNECYYTVGVMNFATQYRHCSISDFVMQQFRHIMEENAGFYHEEAVPREIMPYPDPFADYPVVKPRNPEMPLDNRQLYDFTGKLVSDYKLGNNGKSLLVKTDLTAALYYLYLFFSGKLMLGKKVIVF